MTVYDLAKRAGVSSATVSRVLNGSGPVKPATKQRVLDALEASNYTPNDMARALARASTKTVAVLTTDIREAYYAQIAHEIESRLSAEGYDTILGNTGQDAGRQAQYLSAMLSKRVRAMVIIGSSMHGDQLLQALMKAASSVPIVMTNASIPADHIYCIARDDAAGVRLAMDHLIARGAQRLCFVSDFRYHSDYTKAQAFDEVSARLLHGSAGALMRPDDPLPRADGYLCSSDALAARLIKRMQAGGMSVPGDALVTGYDNTELCEYTTPTITSIDSDIQRQASISASVLIQLFTGDQEPKKHQWITPTLVVRGSA